MGTQQCESANAFERDGGRDTNGEQQGVCLRARDTERHRRVRIHEPKRSIEGEPGRSGSGGHFRKEFVRGGA